MSDILQTPQAPDLSVFDTLLGDKKTYVVSGVGMVLFFLQAFAIWSPTPQQQTAILGMVVMLAAITLRIAVKKVHVAVQASQAAAQAVVASTGPSLSSPSGSPSSLSRR
jgi:hypothetical protein